jgi:hypothetical protein
MFFFLLIVVLLSSYFYSLSMTSPPAVYPVTSVWRSLVLNIDDNPPFSGLTDYGYTCRYNREIKKRGRVPMTLTTNGHSESSSHRSTSQLADNQHNGNSPSPPPTTSPDASARLDYVRRQGTGLETISRPQPVAENGSQPLHDPHPGYHPSLLGQESSQPPPAHSSALPQPFLSPTGYEPHAHLQLSSILDSSAEPSHIFPRSHESPRGLPAVSGSDSSIGYPSPAHGLPVHQNSVPTPHHRDSFGASMAHAHDRASISTSAGRAGSLSEFQHFNSLYKAPSTECRYRFLDPVLPYLKGIIPASVAADLLDVYLTEPGSSLFRCASPYILTRIFRKKSILDETHPRQTTPALLATMLWCAAQTADIVLLQVPGSRSRITNALYDLATTLISDRDPDRWRRIHGGLRVETDQPPSHFPFSSTMPTTTETNEPAGVIDDVLTFVLLSIAVSGGDFKSDCFKWWSKVIRLTISLKLNREDERCLATVSPCANPLCSCRREQEEETLATIEAREERRRVFWLIYCLDRHLCLSFNTVLDIPDSICEVYGRSFPDSPKV